ncbi:hypothetical protein E2C01_068442 [Portunus trituberculatus]|uniref:Uncharacterized protein n=1 Tax=Portunus trituberculatus TaxID=210409 RepID=A0A5B7HWH4_PORTR|nr:hypothetical protein [Portunus trituberculatus]
MHRTPPCHCTAQHNNPATHQTPCNTPRQHNTLPPPSIPHQSTPNTLQQRTSTQYNITAHSYTPAAH